MSEMSATSRKLPAEQYNEASQQDSGCSLQIVTDNHVLVKSVVDSTMGGWQACLQSLKQQLPDQILESWFYPINPVLHVENILFLQVPSKFVSEWLEEHHGKLLLRVVKEVFGAETSIEFLVDCESVDTELPHPLQETIPPAQTPKALSEKSSEIYGDLNHSFSLRSYISAPQNNFAYKAVCHIANQPEQAEYNPLYLYGNAGCGKSLLVHGLVNQVRSTCPQKRIGIVDAQKFVNDYIDALQNGTIGRYNSLLTSPDLFIFEDVHILAGKNKTQEGLLYILSRLVNRGAQVVLTSNVAPGHLHKFNPRLVAFLQTGLCVDLPPADIMVREELIRNAIRKNNVFLDDETIRFLAETLNDNLHHLHAILTRIIAQVSLTGRGVSLKDVKRIVADFYPEGIDLQSSLPQRRGIEIEDIIRQVAEYFELKPEALKGVSRKKKIAAARQMAVYLCRELTNESLASIGSNFSNMHHATVIYACRKIKELMTTDRKIQQAVADLKALLLR